MPDELETRLKAHEDATTERLQTVDAHLVQHRTRIDEFLEIASALGARIEAVVRDYRPEPFSELVRKLKAHFVEPSATAALEQRIERLEALLVPKEENSGR